MERVAIIDLGSARIKMHIGKVNNDNIELILQRKEASELTENTTRHGIIDINFINNVFIKKLDNLLEIIRNNHCRKLIITGTHALRAAKNSNEIIGVIERRIGKINIISSWEEGAIIYKRLMQYANAEKFGFIDVGGGSVQLSFGENKSDIYSIPTGAYSLQNEYQKNTEIATNDELNRMKERIIREYTDLNLKQYKLDYLYFGSNCMMNFTKSAFKKSGIQILDYKSIHVKNYEQLYNDIKEKKYSEIYDYFPEDKMFMHGADKALINLLTTCEMLNCEIVTPTNESLSSSLFYLASNKTNDLLGSNLTVNEI